jgi:hypothetical protein
MRKFLASAWRVLKTPVMKAIDKVQAAWPPNRVAVALGVLGAPALAWASKHGLDIPTPLAIAAIAGGVGLIYKWVDGWQKHEERTAPKVVSATAVLTEGETTSTAPSKATKAKAAAK